MRNLFRGVIALGLATALLAASSMAANRVEVRVIKQGEPVVGAAVDVIVSSGVVSGVTDDSGKFATDISGTYFRVRVEGATNVPAYTTAESPVTVTLD